MVAEAHRIIEIGLSFLQKILAFVLSIRIWLSKYRILVTLSGIQQDGMLLLTLFSYVVKFDTGFAPNPSGDYCTLACCKPNIRKQAGIGDWIVGTGSVNNMGNAFLIYAMEVSESITFAEYFRDTRFQDKIPKNNDDVGDNIYEPLAKGNYKQLPSRHSHRNGEENLKMKKHDLKSESVLISSNFSYYGDKAIRIPDEYINVIKKGPGFKKKFDEPFLRKIIPWLMGLKKNRIGDPSNSKKTES